MSEVYRLLDLDLRTFTARLDRAARDRIECGMAVNPQTTRFMETINLVRQLSHAQAYTTPMVLVGVPERPWEQREREPNQILGADLLDLAEDLLAAVPSFGNQFNEDAVLLLAFLESVYAARWGVEFANVYLLAFNRVKESKNGHSQSNGHSKKRRPPAQVKKSQGNGKGTESALRELMDLARILIRRDPQNRAASGGTFVLVPSFGADDLAYTVIMSRLGPIGSTLLERQRAGERRERKLLKSMLDLLESASPMVDYDPGVAVMKETRRLQRLLTTAKAEK
ncbi:MAG: hypothetical protein U0136_21005 [Bdellovibrionota bacterium]